MAIHVLYNCMGSSGIKPCLLCSNVFLGREKRGVVQLGATCLSVRHTEHDHTKLQVTTAGLLGAVVRRQQQGKAELNAGSFNELQARLGWKLDSGLERRLNIDPPPVVIWWDWMHTLFVSGCFNAHVGLLVWHLAGNGVSYKALDAHATRFKWPARLNKVSKDAFCASRAQSYWEAGTLKCSSSEGLCMLPTCELLAHTATQASSSYRAAALARSSVMMRCSAIFCNGLDI